MSESLDPQPVCMVRDPRTVLDNQRIYSVLKGGKQVTYQIFNSTSISQSQVTFTCNPSSGSTVVDRKLYCTFPIRVTMTGPGTNTTNLLQTGSDAPRFFPILGSLENLKVTLNNIAVSMEMADVIHPLLRYHTNSMLKEADFSGTPSCPDQSQNYSDLFLDNRNPLGFYGDSTDEAVMGRGGYPFNILVNTRTLAIVDIQVTEPIILSPWYWGHYNDSGFYNVSTMQFNFNFLNGAGNRMWSHDNSTGTNVISNISYQFNNFNTIIGGNPVPFTYSANVPYLQFVYITPDELQPLGPMKSITYDYFNVQNFETDVSGIDYNDALTPTTYTSNNIQLSSIPRRMYIYVRPRNNLLYSSPNLTDTYFGISSVSILFNNNQGILSGSSQYQLYELSLKNGCNMSWEQWSGIPTYSATGFPAGDGPFALSVNKIASCGSVLCLEWGSDIQLMNDLDAPGKQGASNLQVTVNVYNPDPTGNHDGLDLSLNVTIVEEGTFSVPKLGFSTTQIGVISSQDILDSQQNPFINYKDLQHVNGGSGDFLSGLKRLGQDIYSGLHNTRVVSKGLKSLGAIPNPYAQVASSVGAPIAESLGLGFGGGRRVSKRSLKSRLRY